MRRKTPRQIPHYATKSFDANAQPLQPATAASDQPIFSQPKPSPDPVGFKDPVTDQKYQGIANLEPVPQPAGGAVEPIVTLEQVYGQAGAGVIKAIEQAKQIVFHSVGDTGSVTGPATQSLVADKMVSDFSEANAAAVLLLPLGRRCLLLRRSYLLLRPVLRALPRLSRTDLCDRRKP
ncbi:hypothetical protein [Tunturiibacter gelidiferens]|uniref:hypothetical protein n=1 Tax=Tunturiibacter gelidiferens TaxID=3069689 RepID=UPI003D9BFC76